jgi:Uma2 family endonuclease
MTTALSHADIAPITLHMRPVFKVNDEEFYALCQLNQDWRLERTAEGDLVIMPPAGGETGDKNAFVTAFLKIWSLQDGSGVAFDSSTGFTLPNGAIRSPDAAWVLRSRLSSLMPEQKRKFLPVCPNFVVELRSPSDNLKTVQEKMQEYLDNGAQLGWLIDPLDRCVYVYRPGDGMECLDNPTTISGDPELPGFVLDLTRIWEASF